MAPKPASDHARERLAMLIAFGRQISEEADLERLLALTAKQICKIVRAKRCFIFIKDEKNGEIWSKIARGKGLKYAEVHLPLNAGDAVSIVAATGETINMPDAYKDARFSRGVDLITGFKTDSFLATPLHGREGRIIGVFQLSNKENGRPFDKDDEGLLKLLASLAGGNIEIAALQDDVKLSNMETIYRLAITAEYRDQNDTKAHLRNITNTCYLLACGLGLSEAEAQIIRDASLLHDIGKVAIEDAILLKPGKLTAQEFERMKSHTLYGGKILQGAQSLLLQTAHKMSLYHHERYNGAGYPAGIKGSAIPQEARIMAVADVFDALCMDRVYKKAWPVGDAYEYILSRSGVDFDPEVVSAFKNTFSSIKIPYTGVADDKK